MHIIDSSGLAVTDEFAALALMRELEPRFFEQVAELYGPVSSPPPPSPSQQRIPPIDGGAVELLRTIRIAMPKHEVQARFAHCQKMPPPPENDALAFAMDLYDKQTIALFRFHSGRLSRLSLMLHPVEQLSDRDAESLYRLYRQEVLAHYGQPHRSTHPGGVSQEFAQPEMLVWLERGAAITVSLNLTRHGNLNVPAISLMFGDPTTDYWSQEQVRLVREQHPM